jgi:CMP-N-acetylneuraminic acid synthetase
LSVCALIIIKRNSQRVPGKNFRHLAGRPLFRHILDTLESTQSVDRVLINTDARDELERNGLRESDQIVIQDRSPELCGDHVTANTLLQGMVGVLPADVYLMTHVTNPLLRRETMRAAIDRYQSALERDEGDSLFSVTAHHARFFGADFAPLNHDPDHLLPTQELSPLLEENSCLYLFTQESFSATGRRIGRRPVLYQTPRLESVDIDTEDDWAMAEWIAGRASLSEG